MVLSSQKSELELQSPLHKFRKLRLYFAWPFFIALIFFAHSTNQGFLIGIPVIFLGELIRIWSHGYIQKSRALATDGPYAYVRNPLYVGNFLMGLGFCLVIWNPFIMTVYTIGFFGVYWITIKGEEQRLLHKFGNDFQSYIEHVPRFIPQLDPYSKRSHTKFEVRRIFIHGEQITILAITTLLLILYLRQETYQEGKRWISSELIAFNLLAFISAFLLLSAMIQRWIKKNA